MREIVHIQAGQCGNQIGTKVTYNNIQEKPIIHFYLSKWNKTLAFFIILTINYKAAIDSVVSVSDR